MTLSEKIAQLREQHPEVTHVFWDYFDTVISRTVEPEYVKRLSAARLADALGTEASAEDIYQLRFEIEKRLCLANAEAGRDLEFRFADMAAELFITLTKENLQTGRKPGALTCSSEEFCRLYYDLEIVVEQEVQVLHQETADAIRAARKLGLRNVITSDFYLDAQAERTFLRDFGLLQEFEDVIVSSTECYTKNGNFFLNVLERLHLKPEQVVVIGDHPVKDEEAANRLGMHVIVTGDYAEQKAVYQTMLHSHLSLSSLENDLQHLISETNFPFPEFVLTLWNVIVKLSQTARRDGVEKLHFLSREGEFLRELFERYQRRLLPSQRIPTEYLIASRRSTFLPSLRDVSEEDFGTLLGQYYHLSGEEFMKNIGFSAEEIATVQSECHYDMRVRQYPFAWSKACHSLFRSPTFNRLYEEKRLDQKQELLTYLRTLHFDPASDKPLFLVDVGWRGTIQDHLFRALDKKVPMHGYYIGLFHPTGLNWRNTKDGVLFTEHPRQSPFFQVYFENRSLFEILLGASHGSPSGYRDGKPVMDNKPEEQEMYTTVVRPLQEKFLVLFEKICDVMARTHFSMRDLERFLARSHARIVFAPTREELNLFAHLKHFENFGLFEWSLFADKRLSPTKWLSNVIKLFLNPVGTIFGGFWPALTIRHLRIPLLSWAYRTFRMWRVF